MIFNQIHTIPLNLEHGKETTHYGVWIEHDKEEAHDGLQIQEKSDNNRFNNWNH